jgi:murein DD-endopeptidase MepM/ murein hydrolase activator NlpD
MSGLAGNACEQQSCALGAVFGAPMTCARMWVSQGFGDTRWEHPHRGIDIVCPPGTSVAAVAEGVFRRRSDLSGPCPFVAGKHGGYGWFGALELGGRLEIVYGHLAGFAATDGATVAAGTVLGYEGTSGCSSGYHLHFEVRSSGVAVNPCPFLPSGYPVQHQGDRCWDSRAS